VAEYEISCDKERLDVGAIHTFLEQSYWSPGVPRTIVQKAISNSLCFGVYQADRQVGFARVVTEPRNNPSVGWPRNRGRFLASGLYMRTLHLEQLPLDAGLRILYRSRHVYLLFSGLLNVAVGLRFAIPSTGPGSRVALAGSLLLLLSPALMVVAFVSEPIASGRLGAASPVLRDHDRGPLQGLASKSAARG
jgi:hypothetical protein